MTAREPPVGNRRKAVPRRPSSPSTSSTSSGATSARRSAAARIPDIAVVESRHRHRLHRHRGRRRLQIGQRWDHLGSGVRQRGQLGGWRHRGVAVEPQRRLGGHRRIQLPQHGEQVLGRRRLQVSGRRQELGPTWACATASKWGRIAIHPDDPDIVYVTCLGSLWDIPEHNATRGVHKTTDGGETWSKVLSAGERAGYRRHRHGSPRSRPAVRGRLGTRAS